MFDQLYTVILRFFIQVDTVCNFLGGAKFVNSIATSLGFSDAESRQRWFFRGALAGFYQRYRNEEKNITMDVTTINGGGHLSTIDRPGPTFLMINNFIKDINCNYSNADWLDVNPKLSPLLEPSKSSTKTSMYSEVTHPSESTTHSGITQTSGTTRCYFNLFVFLLAILCRL